MNAIPDPRQQQAIRQSLAVLHDNLGEILDVESGLRDAMNFGEPNRLDSALAEEIDAEAGLEAILPKEKLAEPDTQQDISMVATYAENLMTSPWRSRLNVRVGLPAQVLQEAQFAALNHNLDSAFEQSDRIAKNIERALDITRLIDLYVPAASSTTEIISLLQNSLRTALQVKNDLTHGRSLWRQHAHTLILTGHLQKGQKIARKLTSKVDSTNLDQFSKEQLKQGLTGQSKLALEFDKLMSNTAQLSTTISKLGSLERTLTAILNVSALDPEFASALRRDLQIGRKQGFNGKLTAGLARGLERINAATTDFAGADLTNLDLTGVPLTGIRWSSTTRWPNDWQEIIHISSVKVSPNLYEIREDPRLHNHMTTQ
ncbi:hypothetical protein [Amycolatopsis sp. cmx-11-12]|uniref:hypothetical protein n=1 Tax=Amycolatopsis sp. cmx-11-12 TaxID=2785795 RepID=UPI003918548D